MASLNTQHRREWLGTGLALAAAVPLVLALAALPLPFAAALVAGLTVVTLMVVEPAFGLYAAVLSVPVQDLVQLPAGLTVTQAVVVLAFGVWLLQVLAYPERRVELPLLGPWLVFLAVQLASIVFTPYSKLEGVLQFARWVASFLAFVLTLGTITSRWRAWGLVVALLAGPGLAALYGLVQFGIPGLAPASFLILGGRFARASATFGKPNPFAGYLNMAWPLATALAVYFFTQRAGLQTAAGQERPRLAGNNARFGRPAPAATKQGWGSRLLVLLFGGFALLLLGGLFASYSRGGWLGAVAGLGVLAIVGGRRTAVLAGLAVVLGLLVGLLGAFSVLPPALTDRLGTITNNLRIFDAGEIPVTPENFAIVERMAHWQAGWRMFQAHPLLGVGVGNFNAAYPTYFVAPWSISQGHAHNYYIHTLAESGLFGLLAYLLLVGVLLWEALHTRQRLAGTAWGAAMVGVCGIIAAVAGHNVFENLHVLNLGIQLSSVWGLAIIAQRWKEEQA